MADRGPSAWRIVQDVSVAPTDDEARQLAHDSATARCWREFLLPLYLHLGLGTPLGILPGGTVVPDGEIDLEHLLDHLWLVGSPDTVTEKITALFRTTGGFGTLLVSCYDTIDQQQAWQQSIQLLSDNVMPQCPDADHSGTRSTLA